MTSNRSSCCNATVTVVNQDEGTNYYACDKCKMPCDVASNRSKEWVEVEGAIRFAKSDYAVKIVSEYVQSLLSQQRADLIKKVKGMKKKEGRLFIPVPTADIPDPDVGFIYNQALKDVLQLLKGEE